MEVQRTPATGKTKTEHIRAYREASETDKERSQFFENFDVAFAADGGARPVSRFTRQNILLLQRTIGNQSTRRFLETSFKVEPSPNKHEPEPNFLINRTDSELDSQEHLRADELMGPTRQVASPSRRGIGPPSPNSWSAVQAKSLLGEMEGFHVIGPPVGKDLQTVKKAGKEDVLFGAKEVSIGVTEGPSEYTAPDFDFNLQKKAGSGLTQWYASPKSTGTAFEGNASSIYVPEGKYKLPRKKDGKDVYWVLSAEIGALNRKGEQEHCNDIMYAYEISLKEAQGVLDDHVIGKDLEPRSTKAEARQVVLDTIKNNLKHPELGEDKTKWASKYLELADQTEKRDLAGWHSFPRVERTDKAGDFIYDHVKGGSQIGVPTEKVIGYSK